jgi:DNA-binding CsgD family transcriptional regulator
LRALSSLLRQCDCIGQGYESEDVLKRAGEYFGLENVLFSCLKDSGNSKPKPLTVLASPERGSRAWPSRAGPVLTEILVSNRNRMLPLKLKESPQGTALLDLLGKNAGGLLIPLHGPLGQYGGFAITSTHGDMWWSVFEREKLPYFHYFAVAFFNTILKELSNEEIITRLSPREAETLYWCAQGKSYWETAVILNISERTVNHHMKMARGKLRVQTNAQAVGRAAAMGLLTLQPQPPRKRSARDRG